MSDQKYLLLRETESYWNYSMWDVIFGVHGVGLAFDELHEADVDLLAGLSSAAKVLGGILVHSMSGVDHKDREKVQQLVETPGEDSTLRSVGGE